MWFSNKKKHLKLSQEEEEWIESNFIWLTETFGLELLKTTPLLFINDTHFPHLYADEKLSLDGALLDLKKQFHLHDTRLSLELKTEENKKIKHEVSTSKNTYTITFFEHPGDMDEAIYRLAINLCKIKLLKEGIDLEEEESTDLFLFMTMVYFGMGDLITHKIFSENNGFFIKEQINKHIATRVINLYLAIKHLQPEPNWFSELKEILKAKEDKVLTEIFLSKIEKTDLIISKIKNAWKMYETGMTVLSVSVCKEVLPQDPKNVYLLDSLGFFLLRLQKYDEALIYLQKAIDLDSEFASAHNNLGYAYLMTNDLEKGNHHLKIAFSLDNENALIERNLGIHKASVGNIDEALKHFERAIQLDNEVELIDYFKGLALLEKGDKETAIKCFHTSIQKGDKEAEEMLNNITPD